MSCTFKSKSTCLSLFKDQVVLTLYQLLVNYLYYLNFLIEYYFKETNIKDIAEH